MTKMKRGEVSTARIAASNSAAEEPSAESEIFNKDKGLMIGGKLEYLSESHFP